MQTLSATASLSGTHAIEGILDGVADAERESRTGVTWQVIGAVCLGAMGNLLEWYDFAIFGIYSQEIGLCFFSGEADRCHAEGGSGEDGGIPESVYSQILFAGGFVVRPLGGMFFGWVSDRSGRAVSLALTIVGMAVPTLTIAALPCKGQIGLAAPILLTICRLVQGVAAGGELPGALVFAVEQAHSTALLCREGSRGPSSTCPNHRRLSTGRPSSAASCRRQASARCSRTVSRQSSLPSLTRSKSASTGGGTPSSAAGSPRCWCVSSAAPAG